MAGPRGLKRCHVAGLLPEEAPQNTFVFGESLAPWKLNRTRSDGEFLEIIAGTEWAMTLVACFPLRLGYESGKECSLERR